MHADDSRQDAAGKTRVRNMAEGDSSGDCVSQTAIKVSLLITGPSHTAEIISDGSFRRSD